MPPRQSLPIRTGSERFVWTKMHEDRLISFVEENPTIMRQSDWVKRCKEDVFANIEALSAKKISDKWTYMKKAYRLAKDMQSSSGFGLTDRQRKQGLTIEQVLEQKCPFYMRLEAIFSEQPNMTPIGIVDSLQLEQNLPSQSQSQSQVISSDFESAEESEESEEIEENQEQATTTPATERRTERPDTDNQPAAKRRRISAVDRTGAGSYMKDFMKMRREIQREHTESQERIQREQIQSQERMQTERIQADERAQIRLIESQERITQSMERVTENKNRILEQLISIIQSQRRDI